MTKTRILRVLALMLAVATAVTCYYALIPGSFGGRGGGFWHFTAFVTLGLLSRLTFSRLPVIVLLFGLALFGGAIEIAQETMALQRDMDFGDFAVDVLASVVGLTIGALILALYRRMRDRTGTETGE